MDVLGRLLAGGDLYAGTPGPGDDYWYGPGPGVMTAAGIPVDAQGAQKLSAWFRGRLILMTVLAMTPLPIYRRLPNDGGAEPAPDHPLYDVLHDQPNEAQDSFQWRLEQMADLIDHGHGYNWIVEGRRGFAHQLVRIDPTLVTPKQQVTTYPNGAVIAGRLLYDVRNPKTGVSNTFTQDEIFHLRGAGGQGILEHARSSLGTALATEAFAAATFGRGTLNGGVIENPGALDPEASKRMATSFITAAGDWRLPKVLEQGSTFKESKLSPEDFQMLVSRQHSVDDIARWLGLKRQMLENSDPSFGNAEQFWQEFLTIGMGGWYSLFEFGINSQLILRPATYFAQFRRQAIARADLAARWNAHVTAVNAGIVTVDEVRGVEDLNKRGGKADELREPQNITGKPAAADPNADPTPAPAPAPPPKKKTPAAAASDDDRARPIVAESAARLLRKETFAAQKAAVKHAADAEAFARWATDFYSDHEPLVAQTLQLAGPTAQLYCDSQRDDLIAHGLVATEEWTSDYLVGLALDAPRPDRRDELLRAALERPQPDVHAHTTTTIAKDAIQVHAAPVTIAKGAIASTVTMKPPAVSVPVTIQKGAVHAETHVAAPAAKKLTVVTKKVTRDGKGQIAAVTEEHQEQD